MLRTFGAIAVLVPLVGIITLYVLINYAESPYRAFDRIQWLPQGATPLFYGSTYGRLDGDSDGESLVVFECQPTDFRSVLRLSFGRDTPRSEKPDSTRSEFLRIARFTGLPNDLYPDFESSVAFTSHSRILLRNKITGRIYYADYR